MIVKVQNLEKGWDFYSNVSKVKTDLNGCFHDFDDECGLLRIVRYFRDEKKNLQKNLNYIYGIDIEDLIFDCNKEDLERYASLDNIYIAKVVHIFHNDKYTCLGMSRQNQVYLLNDRGETIEKL